MTKLPALFVFDAVVVNVGLAETVSPLTSPVVTNVSAGIQPLKNVARGLIVAGEITQRAVVLQVLGDGLICSGSDADTRCVVEVAGNLYDCSRRNIDVVRSAVSRVACNRDDAGYVHFIDSLVVSYVNAATLGIAATDRVAGDGAPVHIESAVPGTVVMHAYCTAIRGFSGGSGVVRDGAAAHGQGGAYSYKECTALGIAG